MKLKFFDEETEEDMIKFAEKNEVIDVKVIENIYTKFEENEDGYLTNNTRYLVMYKTKPNKQ